MLGKNMGKPMHFSGTHEPFGTWDQVSMEWHPKKPHCEDHGKVVHWATSRWDSTQPVPPPQVVDPRYDLRVSYENGILNRMGPNDQGGFTIEWDGVQQGTDCHPSKPKNTQRLKYDEDYHSSNPTVWHKFAQPTHLAPKKKPVFWEICKIKKTLQRPFANWFLESNRWLVDIGGTLVMLL